MADALNSYIAAMAQLQDSTLSPHEQLSKAASLPDEYLMNYPILSHGQAIMAARWQLHNPQLFNRQLRQRTPHIARRPLLPRKSLNSWMAFRCKFPNSLFCMELITGQPFISNFSLICSRKKHPHISQHCGSAIRSKQSGPSSLLHTRRSVMRLASHGRHSTTTWISSVPRWASSPFIRILACSIGLARIRHKDLFYSFRHPHPIFNHSLHTLSPQT